MSSSSLPLSISAPVSPSSSSSTAGPVPSHFTGRVRGERVRHEVKVGELLAPGGLLHLENIDSSLSALFTPILLGSRALKAHAIIAATLSPRASTEPSVSTAVSASAFAAASTSSSANKNVAGKSPRIDGFSASCPGSIPDLLSSASFSQSSDVDMLIGVAALAAYLSDIQSAIVKAQLIEYETAGLRMLVYCGVQHRAMAVRILQREVLQHPHLATGNRSTVADTETEMSARLASCVNNTNAITANASPDPEAEDLPLLYPQLLADDVLTLEFDIVDLFSFKQLKAPITLVQPLRATSTRQLQALQNKQLEKLSSAMFIYGMLGKLPPDVQTEIHTDGSFPCSSTPLLHDYRSTDVPGQRLIPYIRLPHLLPSAVAGKKSVVGEDMKVKDSAKLQPLTLTLTLSHSQKSEQWSSMEADLGAAAILQQVLLPPVSILYAIKRAHITYPIHFHKHIAHLHAMKVAFPQQCQLLLPDIDEQGQQMRYTPNGVIKRVKKVVPMNYVPLPTVDGNNTNNTNTNTTNNSNSNNTRGVMQAKGSEAELMTAESGGADTGTDSVVDHCRSASGSGNGSGRGGGDSDDDSGTQHGCEKSIWQDCLVDFTSFLKTSHARSWTVTADNSSTASTSNAAAASSPASTLVSSWLSVFYSVRQAETECRLGISAGHVNLNVSNEDFFTGRYAFQGKVVSHDDLHEIVKYGERPLYTQLKVDSTRAWIDHDLWTAEPLEKQLFTVREECMAIALERYLIPKRGAFLQGAFTIQQAYGMALERVCTTLTKGFFRVFAIDHFPQLSDCHADRQQIINQFLRGIEQNHEPIKAPARQQDDKRETQIQQEPQLQSSLQEKQQTRRESRDDPPTDSYDDGCFGGYDYDDYDNDGDSDDYSDHGYNF